MCVLECFCTVRPRVCRFDFADGAIFEFKCVMEGGSWGACWCGVGWGGVLLIAVLQWILLLHFCSNHQEPPDEIFIRDLRIQAVLITICKTGISQGLPWCRRPCHSHCLLVSVYGDMFFALLCVQYKERNTENSRNITPNHRPDFSADSLVFSSSVQCVVVQVQLRLWSNYHAGFG